MTLADLPSTSTAMAILKRDRPLLAITLDHMPAEENTSKTASIATDGETISVNPEFMAGRDDQGRVYMLGFIALMIVHDFNGRIGDRDRTAWSIACNMSIHRALTAEGLEGRPSESTVLDEAEPMGTTAEQIYDDIMTGRTMILGKTFDEHWEQHEAQQSEKPEDPSLPPLGEIVDETGGAMADGMGGYTREQLDAAFDQVKDPVHWKNPIDAVVDADMKPILDRAIPYFTGMPADFDDEGVPPGKVRVLCDGYFAGPCN